MVAFLLALLLFRWGHYELLLREDLSAWSLVGLDESRRRLLVLLDSAQQLGRRVWVLRRAGLVLRESWLLLVHRVEKLGCFPAAILLLVSLEHLSVAFGYDLAAECHLALLFINFMEVHSLELIEGAWIDAKLLITVYEAFVIFFALTAQDDCLRFGALSQGWPGARI